MEVSMPTEDAERNVIGSALADDITLKRQDRDEAVYSAKSLVPEKPQAAPAASRSSGGDGGVVGGFSSMGGSLGREELPTILTNGPSAGSPMTVSNGDRRNSCPRQTATTVAGVRSIAQCDLKEVVPRKGAEGSGNGNGNGNGSSSGSGLASPRSSGLTQKRKILNMPNIGGGSITTGSSALRAKGLVGPGSPKRARHKSPIAGSNGHSNGNERSGIATSSSSSSSQGRRSLSAAGAGGGAGGGGSTTPGASASSGKANTRHIQQAYPSPFLVTAPEAGKEGAENKHGGDGQAGTGGGGAPSLPPISTSAHSSTANLSDLPKVVGIGRLDTDEINEGFELCHPCWPGSTGTGLGGNGGNNDRLGVDAVSRGSVGSVGSFFEQGHNHNTYYGIGGHATTPWTTRTRTIAVQEGDMNPWRHVEHARNGSRRSPLSIRSSASSHSQIMSVTAYTKSIWGE